MTRAKTRASTQNITTSTTIDANCSFEAAAKCRKLEPTGCTRFVVSFLGLTIAAVNFYAQSTFCVAIVEMVLRPEHMVTRAATNRTNASRVIANSSNHSDIKLNDPSCPIDIRYFDYYEASYITYQNREYSQASGTIENDQASGNGILGSGFERFDWDATHQGLLLGAFAFGVAPLQVICGRLAEIYGPKWVLLISCLGTALTNLTIPMLAHLSFSLLLINRLLMGVSQAGMEPGLMCLLSNWLVPSECGFFISMLLFAFCMGGFLGSLCSSYLLTLHYGWPMTYYTCGILNLIVALVWLCFADSSPNDSRFISIDELNYIDQEQQVRLENCTDSPATKSNGKIDDSEMHAIQQQDKSIESSAKETTKTPWKNILSSPAVWAFIICKVSIRWSADVLGIELPTYLNNVLHLSMKINGIINSLSTALFAIFSFIIGYIISILLKSNQLCLTKTQVRKSAQSIASFGSGLALFLMAYNACDIKFSMSMLLIASGCLVFGTGGELQIAYDMTSKYTGTLHGMACTLSVSGWLAPAVIGLILGDQPNSKQRWSLVWYLTAAFNIIGGLIFVIWADASDKDFDKSHKNSNARLQHMQLDSNSSYDNVNKRKHPEIKGNKNLPTTS